MLTTNDEWLTPEELASLFHVPVATIYQWRYRGTGPAATKVGRHLRYRRSEVDRWADEQTSGPGHAA